MTEHELHIKYGTSRGRYTYGYTTVSLYERGERKAACNGGGYDMRGTVFAGWLTQTYQAQLMALGKKGRFATVTWDGKPEGGYTRSPSKKNELYGGTYYNKGTRGYDGKKDKPPSVRLDGACGFTSMERIAEAIGLKVRLINAGRNLDIILVREE